MNVPLPVTPAQTVGPFFLIGLCRERQNELVAPERPDALRLIGRVLDGVGEPVNDALLELWQREGWGRCPTDAEGRFEFVTVKPAALRGAPHLVLVVFARGLLRHLATRVYFPDEEDANAADPVLSSVPDEERRTLVAQAEDGALRFDVHLQGDRQTVFFAV